MHHAPSTSWDDLLIVSAVHRSRAIFEWIFSLPLRSAAGQEQDAGRAYTLGVMGVVDIGMEESVLKHRKEREAKSLANVWKVFTSP